MVEGTVLIVPLSANIKNDIVGMTFLYLWKIPENRPLTNHVDDGDHDDHYDHDLHDHDDYVDDDYDVVYQA